MLEKEKGFGKLTKRQSSSSFHHPASPPFILVNLSLVMFLFCLLFITFPSQDLDECVGNNHDCSKNGICTNTHGSYKCHCASGYSGDGRSCAGIALGDLPSLRLSLRET